jgi:WD40 repeat protein
MPNNADRSHASGSNPRTSPERLVAGRYWLLRELGRGGMGVVWLAEDTALGRYVAVKELRPPPGLSEVEREALRLRAQQEARSTARIRHPNAVILHEAIPATEQDDALYLIMEFVEGPTLGQLVAGEGPLPAPRVAAIGLQLLDVLAAAHALGIVHRDVKPGNILISAGDWVKLTDFGIAYRIGGPRLTRSGVMGTQAYQAPELFESVPITPAVDLWSLGATLYHAADGHGPFDRDSTGATLRAIVLDDLPVPRCEPSLAAAITGLLQRDPRRRATIEQARGLLRQLPAVAQAPPPPPGRGTGARRGWDPNADTARRKDAPAADAVTPGIPPGRPRARRLGRLQLAIAAAVLVLAAGATGGILADRSNAGSPSVSATRSSTTTAAPTARPSTGGPSNGDLSLRLTITGPPGVAARDIAYSPDGAMLVTYGAASGGDAIAWDAATGAFITDLPFGTDVSDVAFSPDGSVLAVAEHDGGIGLWNTSSRSSTTLNDTSAGVYATGVAFSPNGSTLAVAYGSGVKLLDVATRSWTGNLPLPGGASGLRTLLFTPGGGTLAADSSTGYVYVWDVGAGSLIGTIPPPANDGPGLGDEISYSPVTGLLGIGSSGSDGTFPGVRFWAAQSGRVASTLPYPGTAGVNAIAYDPVDGGVLAVAGTNGKVYLWEMPQGVALGHPLDPGAAGVADVSFSPDGKTLAVLDSGDRIFLWAVTGV